MSRNEHPKLYKASNSSSDATLQKRRSEQAERGRQQRNKLIWSKRVRFFDADDCNQLYDREQVQALARDLSKASNPRADLLRQLSLAFAGDQSLISVFLSVDNALQTLIGLLIRYDLELQEYAAWCVTNLCTGDHKQTLQVAIPAAPYCITYLTGQNMAMQDQCAWALGNIAGDGRKCRQLLMNQGAAKPLVNLLKATSEDVVRSAAFALSNLTGEDDINVREFMNAGIMPKLVDHLNACRDRRISLEVLEDILRVLYHVTARNGYDERFSSCKLPKSITNFIHYLTESQSNQLKLITPAIRIIGNLAGGSDQLISSLLQNSTLLKDMNYWIVNSPHEYIVKESFWVLSNLTSGSITDMQVIAEDGYCIIAEAITRLHYQDGIGREASAAVFLKNFAIHGCEYVNIIIGHDGLTALVSNLKNINSDEAFISLEIISIVLATIPEGKCLLDELKVVEQLDLLLYRDDDRLRQIADRLIDHYFTTEDN